jgi:hypothetical protein
MRRMLVVLAAMSLATAACGGQPGPSARPTSPSPTSPSPKPTGTKADEPPALQGASCRKRGGGVAENVPDFIGVEIKTTPKMERVTFHFRPRDPGVRQPPSHFVRFVDTVNTDAEGVPADVEGEAFLLVVFSAFGVDLSGEEPVQIYTGPKELRPGLSTVRELEQVGDFEATVSWGIGLSRRACFGVEAEADHLTLEFPRT